MKDIVPAKHTELTVDQLKQLLNTVQVNDEHMNSYIVTPLNWAFVDLDQGLEDIPLDDYEESEESVHMLKMVPEEMKPLPDNAYDNLLSGIKAAIYSYKLMVLYFEDDDFIEIDPETASEMLDAGADRISALKTKDEILEFIFEVVGV